MAHDVLCHTQEDCSRCEGYRLSDLLNHAVQSSLLPDLLLRLFPALRRVHRSPNISRDCLLAHLQPRRLALRLVL